MDLSAIEENGAFDGTRSFTIYKMDGMDSSNPVRKVFESEPGGGSRRKRRPRQRWANQVTENVTTLDIRNWHQAAIARDV